MSDKKRSVTRSLAGGIVSVLLIAAAVFVVLNQQLIKDAITYLSYKPDAQVTSLEQKIDFTDKGKFYFYASQAEVADASTFNQVCERQEVGNPILGCYTNYRVYVYDVTNTQLDGIQEVTAAHETLHAIWQRMSSTEHAKISKLLEAQYAKLKDDTDLTERMSYYQRTEPGEFDNELHSILGTEQLTLSPELETYYKQFFSNRKQIAEYHAKYNTVFNTLKSQADTLYTALTDLKATIDSRTDQYNADVKQLSSDIESFNTRANNGDFSSISDFNAERAGLVARSNQIDADRASISADIDTYNTKYEAYQKVSSQIEALNNSIDSIKNLQPTPSVS